jgi:hypothetical protein
MWLLLLDNMKILSLIHILKYIPYYRQGTIGIGDNPIISCQVKNKDAVKTTG